MAAKGQPWYGVPANHPTHRSMARVLRAFRPGVPVTVWAMTEAYLGRDAAASMDRRSAAHRAERTIRAAERLGFIRRLPVRVRPPEGEPSGPVRFRRCLAYSITDDGRLFLDRHDRYMKSVCGGREERPWYWGPNHERNRRYRERSLRKRERMPGTQLRAPNPRPADTRQGKKR